MRTDALENAILYNGDCMEYMRTMPDKSVDFILTDIPYEQDNHGGCVSTGGFADRKICNLKGKNSHLDFISHGIDYDKVFPEFVRILRVVNACIFCSNKQIGKIMTWWEDRGYTPTLLVWDKPNPIPLGNNKYISNLEFIVYIREKGATFNNLGYDLQLKTFRYLSPGPKDRIHETEKPQELLKHLLALHSNEGDTVFDPYAGSFSAALACHDLKRKFIGCEILPKYYDAGMRRLGWRLRQLSLF